MSRELSRPNMFRYICEPLFYLTKVHKSIRQTVLLWPSYNSFNIWLECWQLKSHCLRWIVLFLEPKHNPCDSTPCKNGGTCDNEGDSFLCNCAENFEGETCEGILKASCTLGLLEYCFISTSLIRTGAQWYAIPGG